jgi:cysteine desulfurase
MDPISVEHREAIYLDHAATTPLRAEVTEAMREAAVSGFANPSSPHGAGRRAKRLLEDSRERILTLLGGRVTGPRRDRLVFTSGATEANRLAVLGAAATPRGTILHSARDHGSIITAATDLEHRGWQRQRLPLRADGTLDLTGLDAVAADPRVLVATLACGQTGSLEDADAVARATTASQGLACHVDATQAVVSTPVDLCHLPASTLTIAPHKFGGPRGIGAVVIRAGVTIAPLLPGPQELGLRGGTEPVTLAAGFARALELAVAEREEVATRLERLRTRLERAVVGAARRAGLEAIVIAADGRRVAHITTIAIRGIDRQAFVMAADLAGVCCASGTACASGASDPAPALEAMGLPRSISDAAVRLSLGRDTTAATIDEAGTRLAHVLATIGAGGTRRDPDA